MAMERVFPPNSPTPRGPYSPAIRAGDFIFVSGQGPIDAVTDKLVVAPIEEQTRITLTNVQRVLAACEATMADVVKCSVFLRDVSEFPRMNEVYKTFFGDTCPARTTVEAKFFQAEMLVEIDCVAYKPAS